ncbi:MAG: UDP-N-acetylglucosamine--N-acetylmuramyl-(pentapeptide) pyrophosphoryl-undecaprenol N-acetylglucosamine transferase [Patescibacteria group bacterium]|mgnify:FL=1
MEKRILLIGGASGGHVYPLLAVAKSLQAHAQQKNINVRLLLIGANRGFLERAAQEGGFAFKHIIAGGLRRYASPLLFLDLIKIPIGFIQALWYLFWFMPDVVFSKGGYDSVALVLVAKLFFIPVYLHESDSIPGLANRIVTRFVNIVFISFKSAEKYFPGKAMLVGNPVRMDLFGADRGAALESFNFSGNTKTLLILGGSQGAKVINDIIANSLVELVKDYQIIHQCGDSQYESVRAIVDTFIKEGKESYGSLIESRYRLYPFLNVKEMAMAYAACDIIISRSGAASLFEIAQVGKPAIIIPLQQASRGEQITNAIEFAKAGLAILEGANITTHILINQIQSLLEPARYLDVSQKVKTFATPGAADAIASRVLSGIY